MPSGERETATEAGDSSEGSESPWQAEFPPAPPGEDGIELDSALSAAILDLDMVRARWRRAPTRSMASSLR